jgi:hypothetical protein
MSTSPHLGIIPMVNFQHYETELLKLWVLKNLIALQHFDSSSVVKKLILPAVIIRYITNYHFVIDRLSSNQY